MKRTPGPLLAAAALAATGADAFSGIGRPAARYGGIYDGRASLHLAAAGGEGKSMFDGVFGNFQLPWEEPQPPARPKLEAQAEEEEPRRKRKPRVPRYPSALHEGGGPPSEASREGDGAAAASAANDKKASIDEYVRSAQDAVQSVIVNGSGQTTNSNEPRGSSKGSNGSERNKKPRPPKLGILLIDHGSKRQASNDFLESIAASYQSSFDDINSQKEDGNGDGARDIVVRAAHMEIAQPSILTVLRRLIAEDEVTTVVCVPYFLSPGKHATIDVPTLIEEAIGVLEEEGLLEYPRAKEGGGPNEKGGRERVQILSSKALGTNVQSMLGVVDGLVEGALDGREGNDAFHLGGRGGGINGMSRSSAADEDTNGSNNNDQETEQELRKYANRAALLENILEGKARQLKTMTNRATLMEDALGRVQDKMKRSQEESARQREEVEQTSAAEVANLTNAFEAIGAEKEALEKQSESLLLQLAELETEYNSTVADLEARLALSQEELWLLQDEKERDAQLSTEQTIDREGELQQTIEGQRRKIEELQGQLADLLDAHNELEQLQSETEATVLQLEEQLKDAQVGNGKALEAEREEKEGYKSKWMEVQDKLDEDASQLQKTLDESTATYESMLEKEKGVAAEWEAKWKELNDELASVRNATPITNDTAEGDASSISQEEWDNVQKELKEIQSTNANATATIQQLELQLQQQKEEFEASSAQKAEQQEQLQKYLRAQLSTYYDTIQDQTSKIEDYQKQLKEMERTHEDSMLIATNSVEASQRREEELLTSIEELESELVDIKKERDSRGVHLANLEANLDRMEREAAAAKSSEEASSSRDRLEQRNKELTLEIEQLRCDAQTISQERNRISFEKVKVEEEVRRLRDAMESQSENNSTNVGERPRGQRRKWLRRVILRPWTLFRRQRTEAE